MARWLYIAAPNYADANSTYELAYDHGLIWRNFYRDAQPAAAIGYVRHLAAGDVLLLGYRNQPHQVQVLGRMRIGEPDQPLAESPVFCDVPANLLPNFQLHDYGPDPILGRMVGIFVEEVEPWDCNLASPGRNAIYPLPPGVCDGPEPDAADGGEPASDGGTGSGRSASSQAVPSLASPPPAPGPSARLGVGKGTHAEAPIPFSETPEALSRLRSARQGLRTYAGIDVSKRKFDICFVTFDDGRLTEIAFTRLDHVEALPDVEEMRPLVAQANLADLANITFPAAAATVAVLREHLRAKQLSGVFIDSPSGFSRNTRGHGRFCEKNHFRGVSFQSTPSVACNREHGADWSWIVYGMAAFIAANGNAQMNPPGWQSAIAEGIYPVCAQLKHCVRECFPTVTISQLREVGLSGGIIQLISTGPDGHNEAERNAVIAYLRHGVWAVKTRSPLYDRADALVAALTALGLEFPGLQIDEPKPELPPRNWNAASHAPEGLISVVKPRIDGR